MGGVVMDQQPPEWGAGLPRPGEVRPISHAFKVAWIVWCVLWGGFWLTAGWAVAPLLNVPAAIVSLALIYAVEPRRIRRPP